MDEYIERHSPEGRLERKRKREEKRAGRETDAQVASSRRSGKSETEASRYIPRKVRDEVHARDKGRCTYVSPGGRRCGSTHDLQIDHIVPFARGGDNSLSNLRLLCGKHNRLEAERAYGKRLIEKRVRGDKAARVKEQGAQYSTIRFGKYSERSTAQSPIILTRTLFLRLPSNSP